MTDTLDERAVARIADLEQQVTALQEALAQQRAMTDRAQGRVHTLTNDITIIAEELRSEAIARDWCADYGNYVDNVNGRTSQPWLLHCEFSYNMSFRVSVTITVTGSSDDAIEDIRAQLENISLSDGELDSIDVELRGCDRA